ncbi:unnamed protein product [Acidithrix sp. C25]|nr:unnamed protein product [Acidithrix sp. C25]
MESRKRPNGCQGYRFGEDSKQTTTMQFGRGRWTITDSPWFCLYG